MSDKKISELTTASTINQTDVSVLVSGGVDYKFAFSTLLQFLGTNLMVGANITFGTTLPQNTVGKNGDVFINTNSGTFAQKISGAWAVVYTLPSTSSLIDGTVLYGLGIPGTSLGNNNDTYIDTGSGIFYKKLVGVWTQAFSMQTGPQGPQGTAGTDGTNGINGFTILSGSTNPSNLNTGIDGDFYINTSNYTFFGPKIAGEWDEGVSLIAPGVISGGSTGQALTKASDNDYDTQWLDLDTKYVNLSDAGQAGGYAPLNSATKVDAAFLPSYVSDIVTANSYSELPSPGTPGFIYITADDNKEYRWNEGTTAYIELVPSPGTTDALAEGATNLYYTDERVADYGDARYVPYNGANENIDIGINIFQAGAIQANGGDIVANGGIIRNTGDFSVTPDGAMSAVTLTTQSNVKIGATTFLDAYLYFQTATSSSPSYDWKQGAWIIGGNLTTFYQDTPYLILNKTGNLDGGADYSENYNNDSYIQKRYADETYAATSAVVPYTGATADVNTGYNKINAAAFITGGAEINDRTVNHVEVKNNAVIIFGGGGNDDYWYADHAYFQMMSQDGSNFTITNVSGFNQIAGSDVKVDNEWHFNQHLWSETGLYIRSRTSSHYWVNYVDNDDYKIYSNVLNEDILTINNSTGKSSFLHGVGMNGNLEVTDGFLNIKSSIYGDNYRTQLGSPDGYGHLILGNDSANFIQAGTTTAGAYLDFWVNCTNNLPNPPNGILALRMEADGSARAYHDLNVNGNLTVSGTTSIGQVTFGSSTSPYPISMGASTNSARSIIISNNGGDSYIGNESSVAGGALLYGNNAFALCILTSNNRDISFGTNNAEKLRLNASGVLDGSADYSSLYSNNSYIQKGYADTHYLTSYTETDPTVPSYAKSLTAFSVIKTLTDALYQPILGYTAADDTDTVHKIGDETIAGEKTISDIFTVNNELIVAKNLDDADLSNFYNTNVFGKMLVGQNRSGSLGETNFISAVGTSPSAYGGFSFINVGVEGDETILAQMKGDDGIFSTIAEIFSGGDIHVGGGSSKGLILQSPDSTYWRIKVSNTGVISASTI